MQGPVAAAIRSRLAPSFSIAAMVATFVIYRHRANIMRKLELHSVSELVRYAVRNQIIEA